MSPLRSLDRAREIVECNVLSEGRWASMLPLSPECLMGVEGVDMVGCDDVKLREKGRNQSRRVGQVLMRRATNKPPADALRLQCGGRGAEAASSWMRRGQARLAGEV